MAAPAAPDVPPEIARQVAQLLGGGRIGVWHILSALKSLEGAPVRAMVRTLPEDVLDAVDAAIREGRTTIDGIVELLRGLGHQVSRSAVGRYKKRMEDRLKHYREAQEVAGVWVGELKADSKGDVTRLLQEMLKLIAYRTMADIGEGEDEGGGSVDAKDLMFLARAIKDLGSAEKIKADLEITLRRELKAKVEKAIERIAGESDTADAATAPDRAAVLRRIREEVYGIFDRGGS